MPIRTVYGDAGLGNLGGTATSLPVGYTLGEVRWDETGTKKYRLFYNAGGASIPTGYACQFTKAGGGRYSVTVTTTSEVATTAACVNHGVSTVPTISYFWGLVHGGPTTMRSSNVSIGTAVFVTFAASGCVIPATVPTQNHVAVNMGDAAVGASNVVTLLTDGVGGRFFVFFEDKPTWAIAT